MPNHETLIGRLIVPPPPYTEQGWVHLSLGDTVLPVLNVAVTKARFHIQPGHPLLDIEEPRNFRALRHNAVAMAIRSQEGASLISLPSIKQLLDRRLITGREAMEWLAHEFEILSIKLTPDWKWDSRTFDLSARSYSSSEKAAARFLLSVWSPHVKWKCGPFNAVDAISHWSDHDRRVFTDWCLDPWWP